MWPSGRVSVELNRPVLRCIGVYESFVTLSVCTRHRPCYRSTTHHNNSSDAVWAARLWTTGRLLTVVPFAHAEYHLENLHRLTGDATRPFLQRFSSGVRLRSPICRGPSSTCKRSWRTQTRTFISLSPDWRTSRRRCQERTRGLSELLQNIVVVVRWMNELGFLFRCT